MLVSLVCFASIFNQLASTMVIVPLHVRQTAHLSSVLPPNNWICNNKYLRFLINQISKRGVPDCLLSRQYGNLSNQLLLQVAEMKSC